MVNWTKLKKSLVSRTTQRGIIAVTIFALIWQIGSSADEAAGIWVPFLALIPPPTEVVVAWWGVIDSSGYWWSWYESFMRVLMGFLAAMIIGIPFGLAMAVNRYFKAIAMPPFEVLRPIPPLAWVPASLIFWPTQELSIAFVTFLGAFYTVVINVLGGARTIDARYIRSASSMGAGQWEMFYKIILPATLPSIFTGAAVGMGITWEVVVAAEMISGGGSQGGGGLGFFIWNSYVGGSIEQIVVGMISIGVAGYISSTIIRALGEVMMPWRRII